MYIQTWQIFSKLKYRGSNKIGEIKTSHFKFIAILAETICQKIIGHEWSETERGYHGTGMIDVWCRWCNFHSEIPIEEMPDSEFLSDIFEDQEPYN